MSLATTLGRPKLSASTLAIKPVPVPISKAVKTLLTLSSFKTSKIRSVSSEGSYTHLCIQSLTFPQGVTFIATSVSSLNPLM